MTIDNQPEAISTPPYQRPFNSQGNFFGALVEANTTQARKKHPAFATSNFHAVSLLMEEIGEATQALNDGDIEGFRRELIDAATVIKRIIEGDN